MVGLRQRAMRSPPIAAKSDENMSMKPFGCISLMSAPAAKAFSLPVTTMQLIGSSASRSSTAAAISRNTPKDSALSIFGRFSVMTPTAPLDSTMMCSNVLMGHPGCKFGATLPASRRGFKRPDAPEKRARRKLEGTRLCHEHARGGRDGEQRAEGNKNLADQRSLVPGRSLLRDDLGGRYGLGRRYGNRGLRRRRRFLQGLVGLVELIGLDDLRSGGRLRGGGRLHGGDGTLHLHRLA